MTEQITRRTLGKRERQPADWSRLDAMTDADIQAGIDADPDAAPIITDEWVANARLVMPGKQ